VTAARAREIVRQRYTVPEDVRRRSNKRARQAQKDARAERQQKQKRETAPVG
jgi:hypothetical protein